MAVDSMHAAALQKERLRVECQIRETWDLQRRALEGEVLHRNQVAKIARLPAMEAKLASFQADFSRGHALPPVGFDMACANARLVGPALTELRRHFDATGDSAQKSSTSVELGWSFHATMGGGAPQPAESLADFPRVHSLLVGAMASLGARGLELERLNVICRRFLPGQSLGLHVDACELFDEDVYGCVLLNTSSTTLEFRRAVPGELGGDIEVYRVAEEPGVCFRQRGEARYHWAHGLDPLMSGERISVTWRWFTRPGRLVSLE